MGTSERERHARAKDVFLAVKAAEPGDRDAVLAELCGDDRALRQEVEALLGWDSETGPLDEAPAVAAGTRGLRTGVEFLSRPGSGGDRSGRGPPRDFVRASARRLESVAVLLPVALFFMWLVPVTLRGQLLRELQQPAEWMPPTAAIVSSLVVFLAGRTSLSRERLLDLGLVHLVVVSFALAASQYWTAFEGLEAEMIDFDVIGFSGVAIWMLLYSVLVPSRPRRTLPFLLASAAAPPVVYALAVRYSTAPALGDRFFLALVFPNLATVCMAYVAVRIVYGLGREVSRARDVGSYRLERLLGQGGMGRVWRASHRLLARPAAVKLIRSDALGGGDRAHEAALARFEREARATASLRSLHTVELYDFGVTEDGSLYYAMELLEGMDLDRMVRRTGPLDPGRAVHLFRQACLSLAEAHDRGLVHRDIKPANLFVCRHGLECDVLKVLDFGLVRPSGADGAHEDSRGPMEGTPAFMAPEVASAGEEPDQRADLYSLGCTLFWALTGRVVFEADSLVEMLRAHASRAPGPPSRLGRGVPAPLDEITLRCLEKDPGDRFQSALELDAALEETGLGTGWTRETARRWWNDVGEPRRPRSSAGASAAPT